MTVQAKPATTGPDLAGSGAPTTRALLAIPARLVRRGALGMLVALAAYMAVEVVTYRRSYPDAASRAELARIAESGAVRALQGTPHAADTVGGYIVWDAGWFLALMVAIWSLLVTTRLLRGEEDSGRAELVLARSGPAEELLLAQFAAIGGAVLACGAAVALTLVVLGLDPAGAVLFGAGLAAVGTTIAAVAAVAAQLLGLRRRAVGAASGVLGLAFVLRMLGNSTDQREWLLLLTPLGWLDRLEPFARDRWTGLLPFVAADALLVAWAVRARRGRDLGGARFAGRDRRPPHLHLLGGPLAFEWRSGEGVLASWLGGVLVFGIVMGSLVAPVVDLLQEDSGYRRTLSEMGVDVSKPVEGFLGMMAISMALAFALQVAWRVGALRTEESSTRLEHLLVRPLRRTRWLAGSTVLAVVAALLVVLAAGAGIWLGAATTDVDVSVGLAFGPMLGTLPVVVLFAGLGVLVFGVAPRATVVLPVVLAVVTYLLDLLAPVLELPQAVADLSPFHWLPRPPDGPFSGLSPLVLTLVGVAAAAVGTAAFARRDVRGD